MFRRFTSGAATLALTAGLVFIPSVALAHVNIQPGSVEPGVTQQFTFGAFVERPEANGLNGGFSMHIPGGWVVESCDLPVHWDCTIDEATYGSLGTVLTWAPVATALPSDVNGFAFTATVTDQPGTWMLRTLQTHSDGWTDPWVYDADPYMSPRVVVGGEETIVNPEGSELDPPCFGPDVQPDGSDAHDGSARDEGCVIPASAGAPSDQGASDEGTDPDAAPVEPDTAQADSQQERLPDTGANMPLTAMTALALLAMGRRMVRRSAWEMS